MNILLACEESQAVTRKMRNLGHDAYSCDILPTSGGNPEWHIQDDVVPILKDNWDMVIAFPPCTHLAVSGAAHFAKKRADGRQQQAIDFFMEFANLDHVPMVAIENPVGIMSKIWRKPDQIIQPYNFGEDASKKTCLWLKGLPLLKPTCRIVGRFVTTPSGKIVERWSNQCDNYGHDKTSPSPTRGNLRSKTYDGIADAIAQQWAGIDVNTL
jgi:site-specific DNA-cytosine methylase